MIQIHLQPEIEAQLGAEAQARGLALHEYIESIVSARPLAAPQGRTVAEAVESIRQLRQGNRLGRLKIKDLVNEGRKY